MISDTHKPYGRMLGTLALGITLTILLVFAIGRPAGPALADTDAPDAWTEAAELPLPLGTSSVQCYDDPDGFYLVGGLTTGNVTTNTLYHYDAATNIWDETLAPMLEPRRAAALACYEGKIYAAGGWDSGNTKDSFYIYDIAMDSWSTGPTLPNVTWGAALGAWDGKLYLVGGSRTNPNFAPIARVDVYDIATGMWTADGGISMPTASGFYGAVQRGPYLYAVGGLSGNPINVDATQRYDMSNNAWEAGPTFASQRALVGLSMTGARLYASGGDINGGIAFNPSNLVEYLELSEWPGGGWTDLGDPLPLANLHPAGGCTEAMTGGEIWAIGGVFNSLDNPYTTTLYRPAEPCFVPFAVSLTPESASAGDVPGAVVTYDLTMTNLGDLNDTYTVTVGESGWTITVSANTLELGSGLSETLQVTVTIPIEAPDGIFDMVDITVTSHGDPDVFATSTLTTTSTWLNFFLPVMQKNYEVNP